MSEWAELTAELADAAALAFGGPVSLVLLDEAGAALPAVALSGVFFVPDETIQADGDETGVDLSVPRLHLTRAAVPAALLAPGGWDGAQVTVRGVLYEISRRPLSDGQGMVVLQLREV